MGKVIRIYIDEALKEGLENLRKNIAFDMKKRYNLNEVTIPTTLSSQVLAAKLNGNNFLNFKIKKNGLNKGILEII